MSPEFKNLPCSDFFFNVTWKKMKASFLSYLLNDPKPSSRRGKGNNHNGGCSHFRNYSVWRADLDLAESITAPRRSLLPI